MTSIPPAEGSSPSTPSQSSNPSQSPSSFATSGNQTPLDQFFESFSPEDHKKFMNILCQNIANQISRSSKKYIEELREERKKIEEGS